VSDSSFETQYLGPGLDSRDYDEQLEEARKALLQSIGVGNAPCVTDREDWGDMPTFDLPLAIQVMSYISHRPQAQRRAWDHVR
jgi:hypothetical protein